MAEVLISAAVLGLLTTMVVLTMVSSTQAARQSDVHEVAYRNAMLGLEQVNILLRGAKVQLTEGDGESNQLVFRQPDLEDGALQVDATGAPILGDNLTLLVENGLLLLVDSAGKEKILSRLGEGGRVAYEMVGRKLLRVTLVVEETGPRDQNATYTVRRRFHLDNQ